MAYCSNGGSSFYLVKRSSTRELLLFGGKTGALLADGGCSAAHGQIFADVPSFFAGLRSILRPAADIVQVLRPVADIVFAEERGQ